LALPVNPGGIVSYAFIIKKREKIIYSKHLSGIPHSTSKIATYACIIKALEWLLAHNYKNEKIVIRGDSELVIKQIRGESRVEHSTIIMVHHKTVSLISKFKHIQVELISTEQNNEANTLSKKAFGDLADRHPGLRKAETFLDVDDETTIENRYSSS
jgi:ribonuclease HI